jgi:hypothetical protein
MQHRKMIGLAAVAALGVAVAPAADAKRSTAKDKLPAKTYRGDLKRVGVGDYGLLVPGLRAKVQLVDGKKNDKASIQVKGVAAGTTMLWHVHKTTAAGNPCTPGGADEGVAGWTYKKLVSNGGKVANSTARSKTFSVARGETVFVDVHLASGERIACVVLRSNGKKQKGKGKAPAAKAPSATDDRGGKGRGADDAPGDDRGGKGRGRGSDD